MEEQKDDNLRRIHFSTGVSWEPLRGYSRAVVAGPHLYISATNAMNEAGEIVGGSDPYLQTKYVLQFLRRIVRASGFQMIDVVRTRMYVTDLGQWKYFARAHREVFETVRPASAIVQVPRLIDPRLLVEMELEAVRGYQAIDFQRLALDEGIEEEG